MTLFLTHRRTDKQKDEPNLRNSLQELRNSNKKQAQHEREIYICIRIDSGLKYNVDTSHFDVDFIQTNPYMVKFETIKMVAFSILFN